MPSPCLLPREPALHSGYHHSCPQMLAIKIEGQNLRRMTELKSHGTLVSWHTPLMPTAERLGKENWRESEVSLVCAEPQASLDYLRRPCLKPGVEWGIVKEAGEMAPHLRVLVALAKD